jgi:hypothetical protein
MATATSVTTSSGGISLAYNYTGELNTITNHLSSISASLTGINSSLSRVAESLEKISVLSTTTGIRLHNAHEYTPMVDLYDWYILQKNELKTETFTSTEFINFVQALSSITNYMPRFK